MPVAIPIIAAAAAYGATALAVAEGIVVAGSIGASLIGAAASFATSTILGAAFSGGADTPTPSEPDLSANIAQPGAGRTQQVRQPIAPQQVPFGRIKQSGPIVFIHTADDDGGRANGYLYFVHGIAGVHIKAINGIYLGEDISTADKYNGLVRFGKHLGADDQVADADFVSEISSAWTTEHRLRGRAYIATRLKYDPSAFAGGIPNIAAIIDGNDEIYDPR